MEIMYYIISLLVGFGIAYAVLAPKIKQTRRIDQAAIEQNHQTEIQLSSLEAKKKELLGGILDLEHQSQQSAELFLEQNLNLAKEKLDRSLERSSAFYQEHEKIYQEIYLDTLNECALDFSNALTDKARELSIIEQQIDELRAKIQASVAANKRAEEIKQKAEFYKLNLSAEDISEIKHLRSVAPFLRNAEPLNKIIWKCYYEKPTSDLVGRVVGSEIKTGIYKITNIDNQMCYIGQAINIADRWKQHIKRGIGADAPTRNKLYPAMIAVGIENFSFEIIEECDRRLLNDREDYWQDFFKAKEFGYSIK